MEKLKKFASAHWRILLVCGLTLISFLLILSVILQMKKDNKSEVVQSETSGKYPISSEVVDNTTLKLTVDGSVSPECKWELASYDEEYIELTEDGEKNEKISFTAKAKAEGVSSLNLRRIKEDDGTKVAATLEIHIIVAADEEENLSISLGTNTLRVMRSDIVLGAGSASEGRVDITSGMLTAVFSSKLEDIRCEVSKEDLLEVVGPDVEFFETEGEETGTYIETIEGTKIPVKITYRDAVRTSFTFYALADGDVAISFVSDGIDLESLKKTIENGGFDRTQYEGFPDDELSKIEKEFKEQWEKSDEKAALEEQYKRLSSDIERNGADAYKGISYTLNLHIEDGIIYVTE